MLGENWPHVGKYGVRGGIFVFREMICGVKGYVLDFRHSRRDTLSDIEAVLQNVLGGIGHGSVHQVEDQTK